MFEADVSCDNEECHEFYRFKCEYESAGDGTEHEMKCPHCGKTNRFELSYEPVISGERIID